MGYDLNIEAYKLFIQLEVGLREFLISSIRDKGVFEWTNNFLGSNQRVTIGEVVKRLNEASKNQNPPEVEDLYIFKLDKAKKENVFQSLKLFHPFYYLNWTDIENLLSMKNNTVLIDNQIGKLNRETIIETLKPLRHLRNDIAHSRFITEENLKFIKGSFDKISVLIPDFTKLINSQSSEQNTQSLIEQLNFSILKISSKVVLNINEILNIKSIISECENSFWLNSDKPELIELIKELNLDLSEYKNLREKQGGLLYIQKLQNQLSKNTDKINIIING